MLIRSMALELSGHLFDSVDVTCGATIAFLDRLKPLAIVFLNIFAYQSHCFTAVLLEKETKATSNP